MPACEGYSKAIDMWSIGSITCALLTGDVIFVDRDDPLYKTRPDKVIFDLAEQCDLSVMNDGEQWETVGNRPKDFIKRLLVLDESQRMTVQEALQHSWFTHKSYASEFEAVYELAVKEWKPRRKVFKLAESLNPGNADTTWGGEFDLESMSQTATSGYFVQTPVAFTNPFYPTTSKKSPGKRRHTPLPTIAEEREELEMSQVSPTIVAPDCPLPPGAFLHKLIDASVPSHASQLIVSADAEEQRYDAEYTEHPHSSPEADCTEGMETCVSDSFPEPEVSSLYKTSIARNGRSDVDTKFSEPSNRKRKQSFDFDDLLTHPVESGIRMCDEHQAFTTEGSDMSQTKRMKIC